MLFLQKDSKGDIDLRKKKITTHFKRTSLPPRNKR
uniref:Uncharacterized protein n=1 Tax=Rhizophora mucronata TaxID=61149 RepID=A0A2P2NUR2_RHIMU